ncbi:hypothetical protein BGZ65_005713 [Modicella reniformis]|uniref:Uncharacterized protein n=1 Tax=Modicella reniformis TaxID=1440133 RepID=A0A9P6SP95_9FUNG|nr:hypothetical protein BGZ65_005713 [Modicella reniformis]
MGKDGGRERGREASTRHRKQTPVKRSDASSLYCAYLDNLDSAEISFKGFVQQFKELSNAEQAIGVWTSTTMPYLASHPNKTHRQAHKRVSIQSHADRQAQFHEVQETRRQIKVLRPNVRCQEQAISNLHTMEIKNYVGKLSSNTYRNQGRPQYSRRKKATSTSTTRSLLQTSHLARALGQDNTDTLSDGRASIPSQTSFSSSFKDVPMVQDRLAGFGDRSSTVITHNRLVVTGNDGEAQDLSAQLMSWRELNVLDNSVLHWTDVTEILSLNFIFIHPSIEHLQDARKEGVWVEADETTKTFIVNLTLIAATEPWRSTRVLWDNPSLTNGNEDTYIDRYVKPFKTGFFGDLKGADLHWTRDQLTTGSLNFSEQSFPDVLLAAQLGRYQYTLVRVEVKGVGVRGDLLDRDRIKLFFNMKKVLDALCEAGVDGSTVSILVQELKAEVWIMDLPFEGVYLPTQIV